MAEDRATNTGGADVDAHRVRHGQLARAVRATGGMTMLSRLGGLLRDVVIGRVFGDTAIGSAFAFAFAVPNMFRRLFGEGALSAAFVPEYAQAVKSGDASEPDRLASFTLAALGLATCAVTAVVELVLLALLLLGTHDPERALSIKLLMVMMPFMPAICCAAVLAGMLQVHGKYGAAASGPLLLNAFIVVVGGYFVLTGTYGGAWAAYAIGLATVLSGVTQALWFAKLLKPHTKWTRRFETVKPRATAMFKRFVPVAVGLGTLQLNTLMDSLIAMWPILVGPTVLGHAYPLDESSNVIVSLTARFYQLPLGVFGIAVATAVFPLLARHANEPEHFLDTLRRGVRLSLLVGLPASVGLVLVRHDAISVLYAHGKTGWSAASVARAGAVLMGFASGVWAYGLNHVFTRAFYAKKDTVTPMRVAIAMVLLNVVLNVVLIWSVREAGLAWATSLSAMVQCVVLGVLVRETACGDGLGGIIDRDGAAAILKLILASVVMGACVLGVQQLMPTPNSWLAQAIRLGVCVLVGGAAYLGAAMLLKCKEPGWLMVRGNAGRVRESNPDGGRDVEIG